MPNPLLTRTPLGLLVPNGAVSRNREDSQGQVNRCLSCGAEYGLDQMEKFGRHVRNCSEAHTDEDEERIARHRAEPLANVSDPELFDHLKAGGN